MQAAAPAGAGADEQSTQSDERSSDQSARTEQGDEEEQSAMSEEEGDNPSAQSDDSSGQDPSAQSGTPPGLEGKVIVIVPRNWQGSLKELVSALQTSPDARDIVIVQQGEPQAGKESEDYYAEGRNASSTEDEEAEDQDTEDAGEQQRQ
jgi:hypothetical protein